MADNVIVLLHGLGASPFTMTWLARKLRQKNRRVLNWGYPSWRKPIATHATRLCDTLRDLDVDESVARIDLVAHSMGSIICRVSLASIERPQKLGRMVMLGPPNAGSHVAKFFAPMFGWFSRPLIELSCAPDSFVNKLPLPSNIDIGILAAGLDHVVPLASSRLHCARDHAVINNCLHSGLLFNQEVVDKTIAFLDTGSFRIGDERQAG